MYPMIIEKVAYDKSTTVACGQEHYRTSSKPKSSFAEAMASKDVLYVQGYKVVCANAAQLQ
jgi:hypothetical protein